LNGDEPHSSKAQKLPPSPAERVKVFFDFVKTVLIAMLLAFGFRSVALEPFTIPSGSMIPTLLVGDYLFVSKISYGYSRYSFPLSLPLFEGRIFADEPKRGDVVVFRLPRDTSIDYIKRVIGLPGDTVQMKQGRLYINDTLVPREKLPDYQYRNSSGSTFREQRYIETLPGGAEHVIIESNDSGPYDNTRQYVVPEGHYFMMGDNRDNSLDSRAVVGFVPFENLVGRAEFTFYSFDDATSFWQVWEWPWAVRWERLFRSIGPLDNTDGGAAR
jgi:signal peptidase I